MKKIDVARAVRGIALVLASVWAGALVAEPALRLASPFTDHMVLQRELPVPVWGTAPVGESVTVEFAGQKKSNVTDADGRWRVELEPLSASSEARVLSVRGLDPKQAVRLEDVLVGEVWLASGQSNMDFTVAKTEKYYFAGVNNEAAEVAAANYPRIRMFTGMWARSYEPQARVDGAWKVCTPENVREFSAIGYFFARDLQKVLDVPVGIVTLTYGASTAQAWIRREAIAHWLVRGALDEFDKQVHEYVAPTEVELAAWQVGVDKAKTEGRRPPRRPKLEPAQDQHNPTVMWNGMIAPVVPFAVRGVLWYQGESITGSRELFPFWNELLVSDWRKMWGRELPFYFCQLAAHQANSNGPEVRELQADLLDLPATAMAVTIDIGDPKDVHPHNKQDVGARLVRIALAKTYGRDLEYSGPQLENVTLEGRAVRIKFSHLGGGLVAKDGALKTFEIAAADKVFVAADAKIDGDSVVVTSKTVEAPIAARYAWSNYPEGCNLFNAAGLPAAPFRTDRPIRVYLIGGQSNATGQGYVKNLPPDFAPSSRVLLYHSGAPHLHGTGQAETWQPLQPAAESPDRFGPELTFGNRMREMLEGHWIVGEAHRIALIKHAHSGTNLYEQWAPGAGAQDRKHWGEQFATFVATVDAGLAGLRARGHEPTVAGMIWLQGEADADKGGAEADAYADNLTHFIARVREQFHAPELIFAYAEIAKLPGRGRDVVRRAQRALSDAIHVDATDPDANARVVKRATFVPTSDLSRRADDPNTPYPNDRQHFGSRGTFELGARMAQYLYDMSVTRHSYE